MNLDNCSDCVVDKDYNIMLLQVLLEDMEILKTESVFLHNNITIISPSVLYVSLSHYITNPCILASIIFDDCFSIFMSSSYTACDNILLTRMPINK